MTCGMHEYYLVLRVHIHNTIKNGDACKFCATDRIFCPTWRHDSYDVIGQVLGGQGLDFFLRRSKKDGR